MKKWFALFVMMCTFLISSAVGAYTHYPEHLNGDSNFILCDGHMGVAWYVDRSSLVVEKYDPPQYIIDVNVCTVQDADRGNTAISYVRTRRYFYNWDLRKMYADKDGTSDWYYLDPHGNWASTGVVMPAGEIAFALAYNLKFYGVFDSNFYNRI